MEYKTENFGNLTKHEISGAGLDHVVLQQHHEIGKYERGNFVEIVLEHGYAQQALDSMLFDPDYSKYGRDATDAQKKQKFEEEFVRIVKIRLQEQLGQSRPNPKIKVMWPGKNKQGSTNDFASFFLEDFSGHKPGLDEIRIMTDVLDSMRALPKELKHPISDVYLDHKDELKRGQRDLVDWQAVDQNDVGEFIFRRPVIALDPGDYFRPQEIWIRPDTHVQVGDNQQAGTFIGFRHLNAIAAGEFKEREKNFDSVVTKLQEAFAKQGVNVHRLPSEGQYGLLYGVAIAAPMTDVVKQLATMKVVSGKSAQIVLDTISEHNLEARRPAKALRGARPTATLSK